MIWLEAAIVAGEIAGLVFSIGKHGWWGQFVYYTQCSNYFLRVASAVYLACLLRRSVPAWAERLRYTAACLTTVTFIVTVCVLIPWYGHPDYFLLQTNGLFQHLLCPLMAIAGLRFLRSVRGKDVLRAVLPTLGYGIVMYALNILRAVDGPYPFMKVYDQPWYMSVIWFIVLLAAALGIAAALRLLCRRVSSDGLPPRRPV